MAPQPLEGSAQLPSYQAWLASNRLKYHVKLSSLQAELSCIDTLKIHAPKRSTVEARRPEFGFAGNVSEVHAGTPELHATRVDAPSFRITIAPVVQFAGANANYKHICNWTACTEPA